MNKFNIQPLTNEQLKGITSPAQVIGGNNEAYAFTYYDTASLATLSTSLAFFNVARTGFATNLETPGKLVSPKYFSIVSLHVTPLIPASSQADPAAWTDLSQIIVEHNGRLKYTIQDKTYGPWPIMMAGSLGGLTGFGFNEAGVTATAQQYANNGVPGAGGVWIGGSLILTPEAGFKAALEWDTPGPTLTATTDVMLAMTGVVYRAIL